MECVYQGYFQNYGHFQVHDTSYYSARRELVDTQQHTTNASRWHPYARQPQPATHRQTDLYNQYPPHFDYSQQFPVWNDLNTDASIPNSQIPGNWYPNNAMYSYPNLNFLHERVTKPVQEENTCLGKLSPTQTFPVNNQYLYSGLGENYEQYQPCNPASRRSTVGSTGPTRTRDKYRVVYTDAQRIALEDEYKKCVFITEERRAELAKETDLSERQIKFWFQNRRVKDRRKTSTKTRNQQKEEDTKPATPPNNGIKRDQADDQPNNLPPCRFAETRLNTAGVGDIRPGFNSVNNALEVSNSVTQGNYSCLVPPSGMRYPVSPSEWGTLSEATLLTTLNVSPILTSMDNDLNQRS